MIIVIVVIRFPILNPFYWNVREYRLDTIEPKILAQNSKQHASSKINLSSLIEMTSSIQKRPGRIKQSLASNNPWKPLKSVKFAQFLGFYLKQSSIAEFLLIGRSTEVCHLTKPDKAESLGRLLNNFRTRWFKWFKSNPKQIAFYGFVFMPEYKVLVCESTFGSSGE